jgi:ribosomal protein S18 acetylase RimI-like enzyme
MSPGTVHQEAIDVRPLAPADLPAVCRLHAACFTVHSTRRFIERAYYPTFLAPGSTGFGFVATSGGRLVGYCVAALDDAALHRAMLRRHPCECLLAAVAKLLRGRRVETARARRPGPRLHYLAVAPGARGGGLGPRLSRLAQAAIREAGHACCWTRISPSNPVSVGVHERMGFRLDPERAVPGAAFQDYRLELGPQAGRERRAG